MKTRYIFDLDGTLLHGNFDESDKYFEDIYGEQAHILTENMGNYLNRYERTYPKYDFDTLSKYLSLKSGLEISPKVVKDWAYEIGNVLDFKEDELIEVLESLKSSKKSLAVLTNWFGISQIPRLERAGIIDYFDNIYTGDQMLKPHKAAYLRSAKGFNPKEVVFIGDNVDFDYIGPKSCGYDAILYDKEDIEHETIQKVKRIKEVLNIE